MTDKTHEPNGTCRCACYLRGRADEFDQYASLSEEALSDKREAEVRADEREKFIDLLWERIDKRPQAEDHRCVDGELSMACDAHRAYDNAMNEVRNAIKSALRAAARGEG